MIGATHPVSKIKGSEASAVTLAPGNDQRFAAMSLIEEIDYGTPASKSEKSVTLTIAGPEVGVPEGASIMRAAMRARHRYLESRLSPCLERRDAQALRGRIGRYARSGARPSHSENVRRREVNPT